MELITEFEFELPKGYVDENGEVHKKGTMRLDFLCGLLFSLEL